MLIVGAFPITSALNNAQQSILRALRVSAVNPSYDFFDAKSFMNCANA